MSETKDILEAVYQSLGRAQALAALSPQDKGIYYALTCPACGKREAYIYKAGAPRIRCNRRDKCGLNQSLWDYIQASRGLSNQETLQELARLAGYTLPALDADGLERIERARAQANAWETALGYFRRELEGDAGGPVRGYLKGRGFSEAEAGAAMNALKHGLRASSLAVPILENPEDWEAHRLRMVRDLGAVGYLETVLSERVAALLWRLGRVVRYETDFVSAAVDVDVAVHNEG